MGLEKSHQLVRYQCTGMKNTPPSGECMQHVEWRDQRSGNRFDRMNMVKRFLDRTYLILISVTVKTKGKISFNNQAQRETTQTLLTSPLGLEESRSERRRLHGCSAGCSAGCCTAHDTKSVAVNHYSGRYQWISSRVNCKDTFGLGKPEKQGEKTGRKKNTCH